mmetsp:Transcript_31661/g.104924  ORF Transcript_31661/g.104924 Transcript_31661/m.104924 type:complete len:125 (-) Transcript_31661:539-913(-)
MRARNRCLYLCSSSSRLNCAPPPHDSSSLNFKPLPYLRVLPQVQLGAQQSLPQQHMESSEQHRPIFLSQQIEPPEQQLVPQHTASLPQQSLPSLQHVPPWHPWQPFEGGSYGFGSEPKCAAGSA